MSVAIRLTDGRDWGELTLDEQGEVALQWLRNAEAAGVPIAEWLTGAEDEEQLDIAA